MSAILNGLDSPIQAVLGATGPFSYRNGLKFEAGKLCVTQDLPDYFHQGLGFSNGDLCVAPDGVIDHWQSGSAPVTADGMLVATSSAIEYYSHGIGYAGGAVVMEGLLPVQMFILDAQPTIVHIVAEGQVVSSSSPLCGIIMKINGEVTGALGGTNLNDALQLELGATVLCGDIVTVSYDDELCDMAVDGEPVKSFPDSRAINNVSSPQPTISLPATVSATVGSPIDVVATSAEVTSYQWFYNGEPIPGETTDTLSRASALVEWNGMPLSCQATNPCGVVMSNTCMITITDEPLVVWKAATYERAI